MTQEYSFFTSDAAVRSPSQDHDTNSQGIGNSDLQALYRSLLDSNAGPNPPSDPAAGVPFDGMMWLNTTSRIWHVYSTTKTGGAGWVEIFEVNDGAPINAPSASADTAWPIGSIYLQVNGGGCNHTFGTWVPFAAGRFLACVGSGTDPSGSWTIVEGVDGGQRFITLNATQVPPHTHPFSVPGLVNFNVSVGQGAAVSQRSGTFNGVTAVQSGSTGQPFDAMPPYASVYAWRRTA